MKDAKTMFDQLFCKHDWERKRDTFVAEGHYVRIKAKFVCRKCGKVVLK